MNTEIAIAIANRGTRIDYLWPSHAKFRKFKQKAHAAHSSLVTMLLKPLQQGEKSQLKHHNFGFAQLLEPQS